MTSPSGLWAEGDSLSPTNLNRRNPVGTFPAKTYHVAWAPGSGTTQINNAITNALAGGYNAVFIDASRLPYDASAVTFNNAVHMIREGGNPTLDEWDATAYGADVSVFNHTAIQAAIDGASAAPIGRHTVRIEGSLTVEKPLWAKPIIRLVGAPHGINNQQMTTLQGAFRGGPIVFNANTNATVVGLTTALVGSGNAWQGNQYTRWFNLRDHKSLDINGLSQFCVECFVKHAAPTNNTAIVWSSGRLVSTDNNQAFYLTSAFATGIAQFGITLTSGFKTIDSLASIADNVVHHLAGTYDGTTVRFFVDGVLQGSVAGTGTVVQAMWEDVTVGVQSITAPEQNFDASGASIIIDSLRISNTARYTTGFSAPTQKLTNDGTVLALMNFDEQWGPLTKVQTKDGNGWALERNDAFQGWSGFEIDGIGFNDVSGYGTTAIMLLPNSFNWGAENINITSCRNGVYSPGGNTYGWKFRRFYMQGFANTTNARYGFALSGNGSIGHIDGGWFQGYGIHLALGGSSIHVDSIFFQQDQSTIAGLYAAGETVGPPIQVDNCNWNNEPGSTAAKFRADVILRQVAGNNGAIFSTCALESANAVSSAPYVITDGAVMADFRSTLFRQFGLGAPTAITNVIGTLSHPIMFDHCVQGSSWIPWSDTTGTAVVTRIGPIFSASTGSTINFDAYAADEWDLTLTSDVTQSRWTHISYGQPVSGAIKMDSTGSRLFVWPTNSKGTATLSYGSSAVNTFTGFYDGVNVILTSVRTGL